MPCPDVAIRNRHSLPWAESARGRTPMPRSALLEGASSLTNDVTGAQSAGWSGVWLNRDGLPQPSFANPDLTISSLHQLKPWLHGDR